MSLKTCLILENTGEIAVLLKSITGLPKQCFHVLYGEIRLTSEKPYHCLCNPAQHVHRPHILQPHDDDSDANEHNHDDGDDDDDIKVILQCSEVDWHIQ